jgi:hypothetical protein
VAPSGSVPSSVQLALARQDEKEGCSLGVDIGKAIPARRSDIKTISDRIEDLAGATGLEPAAPCVTVRRSNQTELRPGCYVV